VEDALLQANKPAEQKSLDWRPHKGKPGLVGSSKAIGHKTPEAGLLGDDPGAGYSSWCNPGATAEQLTV
jgi:hypothetical protein